MGFLVTYLIGATLVAPMGLGVGFYDELYQTEDVDTGRAITICVLWPIATIGVLWRCVRGMFR